MIPHRPTSGTAIEIHRFEQIAISIALLSYPVLLLTLHGGMNLMFGILFIIALICLTRNRRNLADTLDFPNLTLFSVAMASPLIAILLSQLSHSDLRSHQFDGASRLLLAIPILLVLRKVSIKHLGIIQYGFPLGAIGALFAVKLYAPNLKHPGSVETYFLNHIHLGDLSLMLGALSLLSIHWMHKDPHGAILLKCVGFIAGLYVSVQTGARGGWVALPALFLIWFYFRGGSKPWLKIGLAAVLSLIIFVACYFLVDSIRSRIDLIYSDLAAFARGNPDTSIGIRIQLWKAALHLFWENPLFGVGADGFKSAAQMLAADGSITPTAGHYGGAEVHSEMLAHLVRFGIFGLISILMVYFVPLALFLRLSRTDLHPQRMAAVMGIFLVVGFLIFGLTVEIFNLKMTIAFFSLTLAVLFAVAANKSEQ